MTEPHSTTLADTFGEDLGTNGWWIVEAQRRNAEMAFQVQGREDNGSFTQVGTKRSVFSSHILPLAVAAIFNGPASALDLRRAYQPRAETQIVSMAWHLDEDYWEPTPQLITNAQVRALNALLETPYTNNHDFDYFADE